MISLLVIELKASDQYNCFELKAKATCSIVKVTLSFPGLTEMPKLIQYIKYVM